MPIWDELAKWGGGFSKIAGVEVVLGDGPVSQVNVIVVIRKGKSLAIFEQWRGLKDINEVFLKIPNDIPVVLIINGKGVVVKKTEAFVDGQDPFQMAFPGIDGAQFVYEIVPLESGAAICIVRKEKVEELLHTFTQHKFRVVSLRVGLAPVEEVLATQTGFPDNFFTTSWNIRQHQGKITYYTESETLHRPEEYRIGNDKITNSDLLPFAATIPIALNIPVTAANSMGVEIQRRDFLLERFFRRSGIILLSCLLVILLGNAYFFMEWSTVVQQQRATIGVYKNQIDELDTLKKKLAGQRKFAEQNPIQQRSRVSMYADQIAASMPAHIKLTSLQVFPPLKKNRKDLISAYEIEIIRIKGKTERSLFLNEWMHTLRSLHWVSAVTVLPYSENQVGLGTFELEVKVK